MSNECPHEGSSAYPVEISWLNAMVLTSTSRLLLRTSVRTILFATEGPLFEIVSV